MATIHSLFLGFLSIALCISPATGNAVLDGRCNNVYARVRKTDLLRQQIDEIAANETGVREMGGDNKGPEISKYLAYVGLGDGHEWCAAFASWCYGQAGRSMPRNAWSPALFPKARCYTKEQLLKGDVRQADLFAIYSSQLKRIHHVGLVKAIDGPMLISVEGNSHDRVESRRRPLTTIYAIANWID
ncbi:CHAP domain-containing protein [Sphingobacterium paramultivorum]|uniref:CHAP domain-containing protein n=1 Tax=Sphingobacterium paramultivorum TaxID=2886510 RepID=A0A7G5E6W5_9SPHI|nr:CHAP domain-containing protein [Sphingobacterium paramultivorum]QMV69740.1 CHAP domain-containing protein [Sphingobacterium paramultivorum]WSO13562.1 CHAP domain-containing protein [Sphingobacterium paramultivorum]